MKGYTKEGYPIVFLKKARQSLGANLNGLSEIAKSDLIKSEAERLWKISSAKVKAIPVSNEIPSEDVEEQIAQHWMHQLSSYPIAINVDGRNIEVSINGRPSRYYRDVESALQGIYRNLTIACTVPGKDKKAIQALITAAVEARKHVDKIALELQKKLAQ